jgi:glycerophosphoryl diester phosphodiesterase
MTSPLVFHPPVIAHRGVRRHAPENTVAAFKRVHASGATWFEIDVKLSRDGVPIVFHDDTLERTTNGHGAVADMDWAQLKELDAGSWFNPAFTGERIPHLADALRIAADQRLQINVELKPCPGRTLATTMVTMIEIAKIWTDRQKLPLISSFDIEALVISSRMHPEWPRGLLIDVWRDDWPDIAIQTQATSVHFNQQLLSESRLDNLRQSARPILAYTVNDPLRAQSLLKAGVAAVFSDDPATLITALPLDAR